MKKKYEFIAKNIYLLQGNISTGLIPTAAFAVVPRTPAPQTPPGTNMTLAGSTRVLNSSMLGKMTVINPRTGEEEDPFSDPESSLYDYQVMEEAGQRISYSDREPAPLPSTGREHAIDEVPDDQFYHILEKQTQPSQDIEDLYAKPMKKGKRQSTGEESTLQQTGQRVREAYREVQQMDSDTEIEEEMVTKVTIERPLHSSVASDRIPSPSPRGMRTSSPGRGGTSVHQSGLHSGSNTARSISEIHTARSMDRATRNLEGENSLLKSLNESLTEEVKSYKKVTTTLEKGDRETAANLLLKKQLQDMREENETLKNTAHRLNTVLSDYQAKFRTLTPEEKNSGLQGLPNRGPVPSWLINTKYLSPLFLAYDDRLDEKEKLIRRYQLEMEQLKLQAEDIVTENQQLQEKVEKLQTEGPVDLHEWENLKENARLVLEENQNLIEQINVKDQKSHDMHQAHLHEVSKISKQLVYIKSEKTDLEQDLDDTKRKLKDAKNKYEALSMEVGDKKSIEEYINNIAEIKKEKATIEESHREEVENLKIKMQAIQMERKNQSLHVNIKRNVPYEYEPVTRPCSRAYNCRKLQTKILYLQRAIEQSENKEMSVQEHMASIIKFAEKTAYERDTYAKVAKEQESETKKAINRVMANSVSQGKMQEKLKLYKMRAAAKLNTVAGRLKEQDEAFNSQKQEYEREIKHLRSLLSEKEHVLYGIAKDKKDVEEELEIVWNAATSENDRMKNVLQKTMKKLRKHEHLSQAMDAIEAKEKVFVSSDEDGE
ncbi:hypothetical protein FSP39_009479 [Pinctada imbricata]|uniref:Centrosomal protein of 89 kDa n=1 Tax=Pinctada imbricata TaxID=66713 RepID=A0AA88XK69_PINIB|nr:hypothetical protein FSP39_009479 [Pinctada imbricata]